MSREDILRQIEALSRGRINDAVRLAFLSGEELGGLEHMDLSPVAEFKRNKDGGVELKFIDRLSALQWLFDQLSAEERDPLFGELEGEARRQWEEEGQ